MILKVYTVGPLDVQAYIIGCPDTGEAMIIDPAGSEEKLAKEITDSGLTLRYIVNTHGHPDHTCGNQKMKALTGAPVLMHKADDIMFRNPETAEMFKAWGFEPAPPADEYIAHGDVIKVGNLRFEVIHTPGHSPGSVCLYGHGYIITGDTLFVGAVGRTDLPGGSFETLIKSLKTHIFPLPDPTIVLPGHDYGDRPTSTIGQEKKTNPYLTEFGD
ncbi:MAG: MBL fold metallo-hydrolase [Deltaproteobacteria bacterium]|nr:MBL fold metallo-hydrolase [Deltaproteobacteria bacterium]